VGPTLLIACLWGAVLVYWLWSRRPLGDPVGSFRNELRVLGNATPARVPPANRLAGGPTVLIRSNQTRPVIPEETVGPPVRLTAAARIHSRQELHRRRRDITAGLALAALMSLFAAVLTGSALVVGLQILTDLVLGAYVYLLARTMGGRLRANRLAPPAVPTVRRARDGYRQGQVLADGDWAEPSYGDFGSYANLAISRGN
jgi:hypothetical protein